MTGNCVFALPLGLIVRPAVEQLKQCYGQLVVELTGNEGRQSSGNASKNGYCMIGA